ncbi:hypothetical protein Kpho02_39670 [Kitasatospora phosalacinea]|uniref:Uncharacterized protein n=1 Tax=Kitasatospora phosalacinea TaxID=2065 RepID=A0A9W6QAW1_9ACTN|nr:hypothetical protein Kpho02_39670 [Kitasatospora phosalacinea]
MVVEWSEPTGVGGQASTGLLLGVVATQAQQLQRQERAQSGQGAQVRGAAWATVFLFIAISCRGVRTAPDSFR